MQGLKTDLQSGQNVGTLDVPVHNALLVEVRQALQDLGNVHRHQGLWEGAVLVRLDDAGQRPILHVFQDDVQVRACLVVAEVLDDVLVVQILEQLDLAHDAGHALSRDSATADLQLLDGDEPAGLEILALENLQARTGLQRAYLQLTTGMARQLLLRQDLSSSLCPSLPSLSQHV